MDNYFKLFLESSTIHGLAYISTERRLARLFWALVVIIGFTLASLLISQSFDNWSASPIKTNIETQPISEVAFPKVTVCPPKDTFTDLNYDLMMLESEILTDESKQEFANITKKVFQDVYFEDFLLGNMKKLQEENQFYNWYHGYTEVKLSSIRFARLYYTIETSATSGTVRTEFFGKRYEANKVERKLNYKVKIYHPEKVLDNPDYYTLTLEIDYVIMKIPSKSSDDNLYVTTAGNLNKDLQNVVLNIGISKIYILVKLTRNVEETDIEDNMNLETMPGFQVKWRYNQKVDPNPRFKSSQENINFHRLQHYIIALCFVNT